jgi:hypothetical protein
MPNQIRLLVIHGPITTYDPAVASRPALDQVNDAISGANAMYRNSAVDQEIVLAGLVGEPMSREEDAAIGGTLANYPGNIATLTTDQVRQLQNYRTVPDPERVRFLLARLHQLRKQYTADCVFFWGDVGGGARDFNAHPRDAYATIGRYFDANTVAHELGHLQGLFHEDGATIPYSRTQPRFATVMAVNEANGGDLRPNHIPYFSNPAVRYNNVPTGVEGVWDEDDKLRWSAQAFKNFRNRLDEPFVPRVQMQSAADVSFAPGGVIWAVDAVGGVWEWVGLDWVARPLPNSTRAKQVSAGSRTNVWCLDVNGRLWKLQGGNSWVMPKSNAWGSHLSAGYDGTVYHVGTGNYLYKSDENGTWFQNVDATNRWLRIAAGGGPALVWGIDMDNNLKRSLYGRWQPDAANWPKAKEVSVGTDGTVLIVDTQDRMQQAAYQPETATWRVLTNDVPIARNPYPTRPNPFDPGPTAVKVDALDSVRAMRVNADGRVWKKVTVNGDWLEFRWKVRMNQV